MRSAVRRKDGDETQKLPGGKGLGIGDSKTFTDDKASDTMEGEGNANSELSFGTHDNAMDVDALNHKLDSVDGEGLSIKEIAEKKTKILQDAGFNNFDKNNNLADVYAFKDLKVRVEELKESKTLHRRGYSTEGTGDYAYGRWWSYEKFSSIEEARDKLAILAIWGNPLDGTYKMTVPSGTRCITGIAAEQRARDAMGKEIEYRKGGATQYWFNSVDASWVTKNDSGE